MHARAITLDRKLDVQAYGLNALLLCLLGGLLLSNP